jgi:selenocysteine lyase/cysteine desulfurase
VETVTFRATYRSPKDVVYYCNTHGIAARDDDHLARLTSV